MSNDIINRVQQSGLLTLEMKTFYGHQKRKLIDIQPWLFNGLVLKEKVFREELKNHDWSQYANSYVGIYCSVETIIPNWAFMLVSTYLFTYTESVFLGDKLELEKIIFSENIQKLELNSLKDKRVLIKGCSDTYIPEKSYLEITTRLMGVVQSLMFGEACSNVPLYKKKK